LDKEFSNDLNLFEDLEEFGFEGLSCISLYKDEIVEAKHKVSEIQISPEEYLFDKKLTCPVCEKYISIRAVKMSGIRTISRDTDFMTYYRDPNPMFYDAWVCKFCGYAALSSKFALITEKQSKLIRNTISSKWKFNKTYPDSYTADIALELHHLALLNTAVKMGKDSEKAIICLKMAWLYRLKKDIENEKKYLFNAINGLKNAYEKEIFPVIGMDEPTVIYLIGELYRRIDDNTNAIYWFGKALLNKNSKPKIKEMVRVQKELINKSND